MTDCIFCSIIGGSIPAGIVCQDDDTLVFMDIHPINPGHVLVIPKVHVPDLHHLEEPLFTHVMQTAKQLACVLEKVYDPEKIGFWVIGFDVPHAHVHVVPLHDSQDITTKSRLEGRLEKTTDQALEANLQKIKKSMRP